MSALAELSALAAVLDDVKKRITAIAAEAETPEAIERDLHETERHLASALRRMNQAVRSLR